MLSERKPIGSYKKMQLTKFCPLASSDDWRWFYWRGDLHKKCQQQYGLILYFLLPVGLINDAALSRDQNYPADTNSTDFLCGPIANAQPGVEHWHLGWCKCWLVESRLVERLAGNRSGCGKCWLVGESCGGSVCECKSWLGGVLDIGRMGGWKCWLVGELASVSVHLACRSVCWYESGLVKMLSGRRVGWCKCCFLDEWAGGSVVC